MLCDIFTAYFFGAVVYEPYYTHTGPRARQSMWPPPCLPWLTFMLSFIFIVNYLINRLALIACKLLISLELDSRSKLCALFTVSGRFPDVLV